LDGQIWALKADSLTSPLIVTVTVTDVHCTMYFANFADLTSERYAHECYM